MSTNDNSHRTELPKIIDNGTNNNYREWKIKSYHKLLEWDLWKYIEGPTSEPPVIPPLRETVTYHGVNPDGNESTIIQQGYLANHQQAVENARPLDDRQQPPLSHAIAATLPSQQMHQIERVKYAKQVWENLRSIYQPCNTLRAATIKGQIMTYRCQPNMNVAQWLNDMQCL